MISSETLEDCADNIVLADFRRGNSRKRVSGSCGWQKGIKHCCEGAASRGDKIEQCDKVLCLIQKVPNYMFLPFILLNMMTKHVKDHGRSYASENWYIKAWNRIYLEFIAQLLINKNEESEASQ